MFNYSSGGLNVCPHCGKANALNAKFCANCGHQLNTPEQMIVCPKCHKANVSSAVFCGACGTQLKVGQQTKICPKCNAEVEIGATKCSKCGYAFASEKNKRSEKGKGEPQELAPVSVEKKAAKGGRLGSLVALILLLVFAYFIIAPVGARFEALIDFDKGILSKPDGTPLYAWDLIMGAVESFGDGGGFEALKADMGTGGLLFVIFSAICAVVIVLQFLIILVRLITGTRNKNLSVLLMLIFAIINLLWLVLVIVAKSVDALQEIFLPTWEIGVVFYAIPVYYLFFTVINLLTRAKKIKEEVA